MQKLAELYRGKAKTVYTTENPDLLILEFRNDTSALDGQRISNLIVREWSTISLTISL